MLMLNPQAIRQDFPILQRQIHGKRLVYLDNAATSQKPEVVIEVISNYYRQHNANVHRGVHLLGDESTRLFHESRQTIASFFGAQANELVIVRNTTEAINQVAWTWGSMMVGAGDILIATELEHHSNLVPWQELARRTGAELVFIPVTSAGLLDLDEFQRLLEKYGDRVKLVAFAHVSNTLGTLAPLTEMVELVRHHERKVQTQIAILVDGAQAAPHLAIDFDQLDVDFYAVSAHKMLGPMGIGALLVRQSLLEKLPPFLVGGGMINEVSLEKTSFASDLEERFTAGTPDVAGLVGWAAACDYLDQFSWKELQAHDVWMMQQTLTMLRKFPQVKVIGPVNENVQHRVGSVAFIYEGVHAHDVGQILDSEGVAVRSGHHCTMPLHTKFDWQASIRVSFQLYNSEDDLAALEAGLHKVAEIFKK